MAPRQRRRRAPRSHLSGSVTIAQARAHVMAPAHVKKIRIEEVDPTRERRYKIRVRRRTARGPAAPDLGKLGLTVWNALKDSVSGYILHIRQNGALVHVGVWNWAQTPADLGKGWTEDCRMHLASVSKFLTAVGTVKLLDSKGIGYDTPIHTYLPTYWAKGANIDKITFRHLLTHRSGFATQGSASDYLFMKSMVAAGVAGVGSYDYENMNFGICRILIPIMNGDIARGQVVPPPMKTDAVWDFATLEAYKKYVTANIFSPAGVTNATLDHKDPHALAYTFPVSAPGWNSGDVSPWAGGAAWHVSVQGMLDIMGTFRRKNTIM